MDYKYIEQLLERYWQCETSLTEEEILRTFFSQEDVPVWLQRYKTLFTYQQANRQWQPLGDDFDARMLALADEDSAVQAGQEVGRKTAVKARTITLTHRLMPLFKAAAVVAIVLTLGNAAQAPWDRVWDDPEDIYARYRDQAVDSLEQLTPVQAENLADSARQQAASPAGAKY